MPCLAERRYHHAFFTLGSRRMPCEACSSWHEIPIGYTWCLACVLRDKVNEDTWKSPF